MPMIDKQKAIEEIENKFCAECSGYYQKSQCNGCEYGYCIETLQDMKAEAEPVQRGEWILCEDQHGVDNDNNNYAYFCSQCHHQDVHSKFAKVNFCWNCGSKMQEGGAENAAD